MLCKFSLVLCPQLQSCLRMLLLQTTACNKFPIAKFKVRRRRHTCCCYDQTGWLLVGGSAVHLHVGCNSAISGGWVTKGHLMKNVDIHTYMDMFAPEIWIWWLHQLTGVMRRAQRSLVLGFRCSFGSQILLVAFALCLIEAEESLWA